ncbi:flagellar hook-length control protein FliK [Chryseomicrobium palamuruense]|uniref:Flagellar hook-length control protein FliK n=1 Tax=Chryseomicrobium palamuruense TaxID=682973 RepID=A0ABV8UVA7_9BACL
MLTGMQSSTVPSSESFTETKANQVPLEEETVETAETIRTDFVETMSSIPTAPVEETLNMSSEQQENAEVHMNQDKSDTLSESLDSQQSSASIPLFAIRTHFEGGDGRKFISTSTPILSTKQLESLAKWSVNKGGEGRPVLQSNLSPVLETGMSAVLKVDSSPVLESDVNPVLKVDSSTGLESDVNPVLQTDSSPVLNEETTTLLDSETNPILESDLSPVLKAETSPVLKSPIPAEPQVIVPLQAPELPNEFQQDSVESLDVTKPEFEKFRFEFARNMAVPLRQAIGDGGQTLRIQVFPENLGHIDIVVSMQDGKMHAQLTASSTITKDILEMQLPQLRQSLQDQGIQVDQLDIELFGEEDFERERPNYQPGTEQNTSNKDNQLDWSDEVNEEIEIHDEDTSRAVDYSV